MRRQHDYRWLHRWGRILSFGVLGLLATDGRQANTVLEAAGSPCGPTVNPIVCENQQPGNPSSEWDISGAGDPTIQGFATDISVNQGGTVRFKVRSEGPFQIHIYRLGYYSGLGARRITTVPTPPATLPAQNQATACFNDAATGLIDCGSWAESATWAVPTEAASGIYLARLTRTDTGGASHAVFIVRDDDGGSDLLFQTSDTTWQAYNRYGGNSLYVGGPGINPGRAYKVSYNRPFTTRAYAPEDWLFNAEYPMLRWLEANGFDVSYTTGVDTDRRGAELLEHNVFLSVGHDEYWSGAQRANVEAARDHTTAPVHLAFFSGNEIFWKTRWEASIDGALTPRRTLVSYKETHANAKIDPLPGVWTGTWRDPRFSPPADGGRPEHALTGTLFMVNDGATTAIQVPEALGKLRFWRNTSVASLAPGAVATLAPGSLGYEWDEPVDTGAPAARMRLSSTTVANAPRLLDYGSTYGADTATHSLTLYRASSGVLVFGAGTIQWSWGLDGSHDRNAAPNNTSNLAMRQATVNLFADMGVQPATPQAGLVTAAPSSDVLAPTSTITSPTAGATLAAGKTTTISGTAAENGGGLVVGVEVSVDGGATWRPASGSTAWSYQWTPANAGTVTIKSRAFDDSGNLESGSAGTTVTVVLAPCPCSLWDDAALPDRTDPDSNAAEVGVRFRSEVDGYITGLRFHKAQQNTGTHVGSLWTNTGTRLATVTFTNETTSGWQQVLLPSPVPITANTVYVASYHTTVGRYSVSSSYFTSQYNNAPLHAPADGASGSNGLYRYGSPSTFPTETFQSENYWVDVVFQTSVPPDTTPPAVQSVVPGNATSGVNVWTNITATFTEAIDAASLTAKTFELRDATNTIVPAAVTYDAATRTAILDPSTSLLGGTTYTARLLGGPTDPRVKDPAGNALASTYTWSFTTGTAPACPCSLWNPSTVPDRTDPDSTAVEVGVRFRADVNGYITALRFYKSTQNTGTHVGHLWTSGGILLASATFTSETASGWQQVALSSPVAIAANTTYVASYHTSVGRYSVSSSYFTSQYNNPPLLAPASGNGVFRYGPSGTFPDQTFDEENYWVDVVFELSIGPDVTPPTVTTVSPGAGVSGIKTTTNVTVSFSEVMNSATITTSTLELRDPTNAVVPATVSYDPATLAAVLDPTGPLAYSTTYTATVRGGTVDPRVKDLAGNAPAASYSWSFTTGAPPPPPPNQGPGGPLLVITSTANPFTSYFAEILRTEGLNEFAVSDISQVSAATLAAYDTAILGEMPLSGSQATMLSDWVDAGGNLIAMRPDKKLAGVLGLADAGATLSNGYLLVDASRAPGSGIVAETIQFHGTADRYTLNGATAIATLYSGATTATSNPAVTIKSVGPSGGQAAAFTYDLARSIVYMRQGNPAWSGQERDGVTPIRSNDLFYGAASFDPQPDWINLNKVAIPQADEQQRLLANLILFINADRKPLPRFWYLPRGEKAVIVMTGDDHANGGTGPRFDAYIAASPAGCSVDDWECIRASSYIYSNTPLSNAQASSYAAAGFEVALHVHTNCANWTPASLATFYSDQLASFASAYPSLPSPATNRTHCIVWSDFVTQADVERVNGIRLDTNYYYFPPAWVGNRPGFFTGSGWPMRFAKSTGEMIDVYQAATQMTDESGQTYPFTVDTLLDRALGPAGYYGVFTANMHTDFAEHAGSDAIVGSALARGVPVVSARQMLAWLDGRNASSFRAIAWSSSVLSFDVELGVGANGLRAMVPTTTASGPLARIKQNGSAIAYATETIKGIEYAVFPAVTATYQVTYGSDTTPPVISAVSATAPTPGTASITWTTNEASNSRVDYGTDAASLISSASSSALVTAHSLTLNGLSPNTTYYYRVTSTDASGNAATSPAPPQPPASFTTPAPTISVADVSVTEGNSGTVNAVFSLTLSTASGQTVTVNYATADGTATAGSDYVAASGSLSFAPGTTTRTLTITVNGDTLAESDETFFLNLSSPTNATIARAQAVGTIVNDEPIPTLSINDVSLTEGNAGASSAVFTVTLSGASAQSISVGYATAAGTATAETDYATASGTVTFAPGTTSQTITVSVVGDALDEPDETFVVNLASPTNATLADGQGQGTIADDDPLPAISLADVTVTEGNAGTVNAVFSLTLSAASSRTVTVNYATADGSATAAADFVAASGSVTFAAGTTSQTITVSVVGETLDEADETFVVNLTSPANATLADGQGQSTILDDDPLPVISIADVTVTEGNTGTVNALFNVTLSAASGRVVIVAYATADSTALAGNDYTASSGTVTFAAGVTSQTISVAVTGEALAEGDETLSVNLSAPTNATIGRGQAVGTIVNDDPVPALAIDDVSVIEGNASASSAVFTVTLSGASGQDVTVNYATADSNATAATDYVAASGSVTFAAGTTSQTIAVSVVGDTLDESDETFVVNLASPTNATLADGQGQGTIVDDDPLPAVSIADVTVTEGHAGTVNAVFNVTLSAASGRAVTVAYATADSTALAGTDYTASAGTVTFAAGVTSQTISVAVTGEPLAEADETFSVNLSAPTNATFARAQAVGTIVNDDPLPTLSINDVSVTEGNAGTVNAVFTVTLSGASGQTVSATYTTAAGTATAETDYATASGTVTFAPGTTSQTITVSVVGDVLDEADETFVVNLASPTNATLADGQGQGTILDNDPQPAISIADVTVTEGNTGTVNAVFTVTLSGPSGRTVSATYTTAAGTATAETDYATASGTVTFAPGTTSETITVSVVGDVLDEADETFVVNLTSPTNATLADGQGQGTILDNDPLPAISIGDVTVTEGNTGTVNAVFTVTLSGASGQTVSATYTTAAGTATPETDYAPVSGSLTFAPGTTSQTITASVVGDTLDEADETFLVNLASPTNATLADGEGQGTILDDDPLPAISIADVTVTEGNSGTVNAVFSVTLSAASGRVVTVAYSTADSTALAGSDYTASSGTATFAAGITSQTLTIAVNGDTLAESDETFFMNLSSPTNATLARAQAVGTIANDEPLPALSIDDVSLTEGNAGTVNAVFTVTLSGPSGQTVSAAYTTAAGTATAETDYATASGTVTFASGTTSQTITVSVVGDALDEPDETFTVNLASPTHATLADGQGQGTILDDDPLPALSIGDVTVTEGNTGTVNAVFTVTLSGASGQTVSATYTTAAGTATAETDYATVSGSLTFAPGTTSQTITVSVVGDTLDEADETFLVNLASPTNATLADGEGQGTILDDDPLPAISIADVTVTEGNSGTVNAVFSVTLSAASGRVVTVAYSTADSTALAGSDYTASSGTATFAAGITSQTLTIAVNGDTLAESDETFFVDLSLPTNATLARAQAVGTIVNDEPLPTLSIDDVSVTEGNAGTANAVFTVTLSAASAQTVSVAYTTAAGTATAETDYATASGSVTFAPGTTSQTITVSVAGDVLDEADETFLVNLASPTNATLADSQGQGTILDDDPLPAISIADVTVTEGNSGAANAVFNVALSAASGQVVTVAYATADSTALAGSDYTASSGTVTVAAGVTSQTISVAVTGDTRNEVTEAFFVNLSGPTNATLATAQAVGTITNDDPVPSITIADATVTEGNAGTVNAVFTATLSAASGLTVTVAYATADNTAAAGTDFAAASGTLTFGPGITSQTVTVAVTGDTAIEPNETFFVNLTAPANATITDAQALGTITNDDGDTSLVAAYGFEEGTGGTTADASGRGHTGTIAGATWTTAGRNGNALSFDGANDWVTVTDTAALDVTRMTVMAWVRPSELSGWRTAVLKETADGLAYALYAHDDAPRPATYVRIGGIDRDAIGSAALPLDTWTHLAATYDGTTLRLYVNGTQIGTRTITGNIAISGGALRIGGNAVWGEYFAGLIDDVRIYNRARTQAEIQADMNTPVP